MTHIRSARPNDARLVASLGALLFEQAFGIQNRAEDMRAYLSRAFNESRQAQELSDPRMRTWIAEDDAGEPIGYAQLRLDVQPPALSLDRPSELARIYADSRWHGHGVGSALLDAVLAAARAANSSHLWLGVWKKNPRGIAFYEKHGFYIAGEQVFELGTDPQHDWIMVRRLTSD